MWCLRRPAVICAYLNSAHACELNIPLSTNSHRLKALQVHSYFQLHMFGGLWVYINNILGATAQKLSLTNQKPNRKCKLAYIRIFCFLHKGFYVNLISKLMEKSSSRPLIKQIMSEPDASATSNTGRLFLDIAKHNDYL